MASGSHVSLFPPLLPDDRNQDATRIESGVLLISPSKRKKKERKKERKKEYKSCSPLPVLVSLVAKLALPNEA